MVVLFTGLRLLEAGLEGGRESSGGNPLLHIPRSFVETIGRTSRTVTEHAGQLTCYSGRSSTTWSASGSLFETS